MVNLAYTNSVSCDSALSVQKSPFLLKNEAEYLAWRTEKLSRNRQSKIAPVQIDQKQPKLSPETLSLLTEQIQTSNFALFEVDSNGEQWTEEGFLEFGRQLGLIRLHREPNARESGVTLLSAVDSSDERSRYIPYTNRALNWHTDGYYNRTEAAISAFSLFCVRQAEQGGSNFLLDHELLYIQIRDSAPELLEALMDPGIMVIPANIKHNRVIRPAESGSVFRVLSNNGGLAMRYSARPQNIGWKNDLLSEKAVNLVRELLIDNDYAVELELKSGQGIICNNVLHGRTAFSDSASKQNPRLLYRARYYEPIQLS